MAAKKTVPDNQFDERRESLVVETKTVWPAGIEVEEAEKKRIDSRLHQNPRDAKFLEYVRCPTGFVRQITVAPEDLQRLKAA